MALKANDIDIAKQNARRAAAIDSHLSGEPSTKTEEAEIDHHDETSETPRRKNRETRTRRAVFLFRPSEYELIERAARDIEETSVNEWATEVLIAAAKRSIEKGM